MKLRWEIAVLPTLFLLPGLSYSHPLIYKGGIVLQTTLRPRMAFVEPNYTFHRNFAGGATYTRLQLSDRTIEMGFANLNILLKRFNQQHSQANIYLTGGAGYASDTLSGNSFVATGAIFADYETRWIYTAARARIFKTSSQTPYNLRYRLGFAPYAGKYSELNTWFVMQLDYFSKMDNTVQITPLMRFFYKTALWEFGASLKGNFWIQLMVHY